MEREWLPDSHMVMSPLSDRSLTFRRLGFPNMSSGHWARWSFVGGRPVHCRTLSASLRSTVYSKPHMGTTKNVFKLPDFLKGTNFPGPRWEALLYMLTGM